MKDFFKSNSYFINNTALLSRLVSVFRTLLRVIEFSSDFSNYIMTCGNIILQICLNYSSYQKYFSITIAKCNIEKKSNSFKAKSLHV